MDDVVRIILVIGAILYYVVKGSKSAVKKSTPPRPTTPTSSDDDHSSTPTSLEDILGRIKEDQKKAERSERTKLKHIEVEDRRRPEAISSENLPRRKHQESPQKPTEEELYAEKIFDLRQAVINDAILNRPKY